MEKERRLRTFLGGTFAVACLSAAALVLPARADAAASLKVLEVNYDNSTITVESTEGDQTLYISDKKAKKWEICTEKFGTKAADAGAGEADTPATTADTTDSSSKQCTIDISWITTTKDYVLSMKGDKSTEVTQITIPKQNKKFKVKYDKVNTKFTYTGQVVSKPIIEYRKNNTTSWAVMSDDNNKVENLVRLLSENGNSLYFRVQGQNGKGDDAGARPSKEVICKIGKKSAAPTVTLNTNNNTISVSSGWQVRQVNGLTESGSFSYAGSYSSANGTKYTDATSENGWWHTYNATLDVPLTEIAAAAICSTKTGEHTSPVYLQFRKKATSSTQLSRTTTIRIPAQNKEPDAANSGVGIEYTSPTTFKLTFAYATDASPYEYCVVDKNDIKDNKIANEQDIEWKTSSSSTPIEMKKNNVPDGSRIFFRKKAIGKLGDDNFELATDYVVFGQSVEYPKTGATVKPSQQGGTGLFEKTLKDGDCVTGNSAGYIPFTMYSAYNQNVKNLYFSMQENPEGVTLCKPEFTSTVTKNASASLEDGSDKYIITTTIKQLVLPDNFQTALNESPDGTLKLYAYIELNSSDSSNAPKVKSNNNTGVVITLKKKSSVDTKMDSIDYKNAIEVKRLIGATSSENCNSSDYQFEEFWFKINCDNNKQVKSIKIGSYTLDNSNSDCLDYKVENDDSGKKIIIYLKNLETKSGMYSNYGTKKYLTITLQDSSVTPTETEVLSNVVSVQLIPPIALSKVYSWAFRQGSLPKTERTTQTTNKDDNSVTQTLSYINNYSATLRQATEIVGGNKVASIEMKSVTVPCKYKKTKESDEETGNLSVLYSFSDNAIEFSNDALNMITEATGPVEFQFKVTYSNNSIKPVVFSINQGCSFSVL